MKKLFLMAVLTLASVGAFAQSRVGSTTIQPKIGLNVSTVGDGDWKDGCCRWSSLFLPRMQGRP